MKEAVDEEEDDTEASYDCDEVCPECMSRRVHTLDLLCAEYECLNCGHAWFARPAHDAYKEEEV
jgi:hypothetical protein